MKGLNMNRIEIKVCKSDNIDFLEDLCNKLMTFQGERARIKQDVMMSMNYNNRLKPEFKETERKHMVVAYDQEKPIGFAFAGINTITKEDVTSKPIWANDLDGIGFFPDDYDTPKTVGTFKLLYVDQAYRSDHIGKRLSQNVMTWLENFEDVKDLWVYVANGNEIVGKFYEKLGFHFSHLVYNGFIQAYRKTL